MSTEKKQAAFEMADLIKSIESLQLEVKELTAQKEKSNPIIGARWVIKDKVAVCPECESSIEKQGDFFKCDNGCQCSFQLDKKGRMVKVEDLPPGGKK